MKEIAVPLSFSQERIINQYINRRAVYGVLVGIGILAGVLLFGSAMVDSTHQPFKFVCAILVLLNARSNLRQYKMAKILRTIREGLREGDQAR